MSYNGKLRGMHRGQVSKVFRFRCLFCGDISDQESEGGEVDLATAESWVRTGGWGKTKHGWVCPEHPQESQRKAKRGQKA